MMIQAMKLAQELLAAIRELTHEIRALRADMNTDICPCGSNHHTRRDMVA